MTIKGDMSPVFEELFEYRYIADFNATCVGVSDFFNHSCPTATLLDISVRLSSEAPKRKPETDEASPRLDCTATASVCFARCGAHCFGV